MYTAPLPSSPSNGAPTATSVRSKEHAVSESDYKGTAAGTVLGGKHGTGGKKYGHAWSLKASSVTKIENR